MRRRRSPHTHPAHSRGRPPEHRGWGDPRGPSRRKVHDLERAFIITEADGGHRRFGVTRADRYEPQLHRSYAELVAHFCAVVIPARPYPPQRNSRLELTALFVCRLVLARPGHQCFFSLEDLNVEVVVARHCVHCIPKRLRTKSEHPLLPAHGNEGIHAAPVAGARPETSNLAPRRRVGSMTCTLAACKRPARLSSRCGTAPGAEPSGEFRLGRQRVSMCV